MLDATSTITPVANRKLPQSISPNRSGLHPGTLMQRRVFCLFVFGFLQQNCSDATLYSKNLGIPCSSDRAVTPSNEWFLNETEKKNPIQFPYCRPFCWELFKYHYWIITNTPSPGGALNQEGTATIKKKKKSLLIPQNTGQVKTDTANCRCCVQSEVTSSFPSKKSFKIAFLSSIHWIT